jgi:membrane-bound lytic murein transglycosylase D
VLRASPKIRVRMERGNAAQKEFSFADSFCIGRDETCGVQIYDSSVSRMHVEVYLREGGWWVRDLQSANGTYIEGKRIDRFPVVKPLRIELGQEGPELSLTVEAVSAADMTKVKKSPSVTQYVKQYFGMVTRQDAGEHTIFLRQAFRRVQKKQKRKYVLIIAVAAFLLVLSGGFAFYQHARFEKHRQVAVDLFYKMKVLELQIGQLKSRLTQAGDVQNLAIVKNFESQLTEMKTDYDRSVDDLGIYGKKMSEEDRLILRIARIFGECELNLPEGFVQEVKKYIKKWQSTNLLASIIQRARTQGYEMAISREMLKKSLPPHFFYLALQESGFDPNACGPETAFGFAKGMWQFIPDTARQYGLRVGRLYEYRMPDPEDERHDFEKSTRAAAAYIRDLYDTEAQASGLLVMASYNWGETRVRSLIRKMPQNPRERNFWHLLGSYIGQIPEQTYNYVFSIISAAVICENPHLFNFSFENPLSAVEKLSMD